ncbi:MAG: acyl carrier protein [Clostridia bacterium]|nr:acyl carrier protein [Clostridia bacterium]MBO4428483.1 acyl carrier protein [Clostridia bacterium]
MFEQVKQIIIDELGKDPGNITPDADLRNDIGITSLELIGMVMVFEDTFDISISEDELGSVRTVGDVVNYIERKKA